MLKQKSVSDFRHGKTIFSITQAVCDFNSLCGVVALEHFFGILGYRLLGKQAYNRHNDKAAYHGNYAGVQGVFEYEGEERAAGNIKLAKGNKELDYLKAHAENEGADYGNL